MVQSILTFDKDGKVILESAMSTLAGSALRKATFFARAPNAMI